MARGLIPPYASITEFDVALGSDISSRALLSASISPPSHSPFFSAFTGCIQPWGASPCSPWEPVPSMRREGLCFFQREMRLSTRRKSVGAGATREEDAGSRDEDEDEVSVAGAEGELLIQPPIQENLATPVTYFGKNRRSLCR